jgi:hypothetical protein
MSTFNPAPLCAGRKVGGVIVTGAADWAKADEVTAVPDSKNTALAHATHDLMKYSPFATIKMIIFRG